MIKKIIEYFWERDPFYKGLKQEQEEFNEKVKEKYGVYPKDLTAEIILQYNRGLR